MSTALLVFSALVGLTGVIAAGTFELISWTGAFFLAVFSVVILLAGLFVQLRVRFVGKDEQLFIENLTELEVRNGPQIVIMPWMIRKAWTEKAISLTRLEYCKVKNSLSGVSRVEVGPQLLFLRPYDAMDGGRQPVHSLKQNEYVRFLDKATGKVRIVHGECGGVVPEPTEVFLDGSGKKAGIDLKCYEYTKIEDKRAGTVRIERGEKLVFLKEFEEIVGASKNRAVEVDEETAVLVRNKRSGQQKLVLEKQLFFPECDDEIMEVRKLIKLADYEACIVRGKDGQDVFYFGTHEQQRAFFLPPYSELVELQWSRGRRRERRDLFITKIDLRPMYMSFEFNCRTADNVELVLEGSFFWEIVDIEKMVKFTNDTTGDICNHARSKFIEQVSKVTLQTFMSDFNTIAERVLSDDKDKFYTQRGCCIHSLEVTGYHCAEKKTADILGAIIQETTNRMNRLQKQESENEVQLFQIKGDIEEERARGELLTIQTENHNARAGMEGLGEAEKVKAFLSGLKDELPDLRDRLTAWNVLRKKDALDAVSSGNAKLFFTPADANLSIEQHDHEHASEAASNTSGGGYHKVK